MKKMLVFALVAMICGVADAQKVKSKSNEIIYTTVIEQPKVIKEKKKTRYLRMSLDATNFGAKDWRFWESSPRIGYEFLYGMQRRMKHGFYYNLEAGLGSRGYKDRGYDDQKMIAHNFKFVPLAFGYKYTFPKEVALDIHLGVGLSIDYARKVKEDGDYTPGDVFLKTGVGVWYKHFNFDISFQPGFVPALYLDRHYYDDELLVKSKIVSFGISYVF